MKRASVRSSWSEGRTTLGAWLSLPGTAIAEAVGRMGFDYVVVDTQHGLSDFAAALTMFQAIDLGRTPPLVRVGSNDAGAIGRLLDAGAMGVIVPMVNTAADAHAVVQACRYAPEGARSYGPTRAALGEPDYHADANGAIAAIPMIETVEAVRNVDEILAVPGIDAVYVGPSDLAVSMGLAPQVDSDDRNFRSAIEAIVSACNRRGVVPGIHSTAAVAPKRLEQGFRMVTVAADFVALRTKMAADLDAVRGHRPAEATAGY